MQTEPGFLQGGGECGAIIRSIDWQTMPLDHPADWPPALRITLSNVLNAGYPMLLFWGPELICFYNDAYRPSLGKDGKHPDAIGKPAKEIWTETWHTLKPNYDALLTTGESQWYEDRMVPIYRNGKMENVYWTYSNSAVRNEEGKIEGVLVICSETTVQVRNKTKLEENKDWLQMALDAAEMGTWELNIATNTIQASNLTKALFGLPPNQEADLLLAFNQVKPQDRERVVEAIKRAIYEGEKYEIDYTVVMPDGAERLVSSKGKLYYSPDGAASRFAGIVQDITNEKAAQRTLNETTERLSLSLAATDMGTFDWMLKEDRLSWDDRCRQLFGLEDGDEVTYGRTFINGLHPDDRETTETEVVKALNPEGSGRYFARYRTISPKGELLYWVDAHGKAFFDENQKPVRLIGTVVDVTDEVNAQQEIAERDARFRLLGNTVGQLVWMANTSRQLIYINKAAQQYTGLTEAEWNIDSWQRLIHPDDRAVYEKEWNKLRKDGDAFQIEHRLRQKNGDYHWFLTRINTHKDGSEFWINSSTDIQLIKENEERKNDFFQMASHELKTPVTSVKAYAQFLQKQFEKKADTVATGMLQKINTQISKLQVLINDLLDVNRMESGKMHFNEDIFYLNDLAREVIEEVQHTTDKHIQLTLAPTEQTKVWGDHYRVGQVLTNLLSNAIKYSPGSNRVAVKIWLENDFVQCCVSDFGIGIPEEQQAQLFNRFYRVTGQNTDTFPGLGLGLYISSEIMKRQNGSIRVTSQPQVGSDFCFSLPLLKK